MIDFPGCLSCARGEWAFSVRFLRDWVSAGCDEWTYCTHPTFSEFVNYIHSFMVSSRRLDSNDGIFKFQHGTTDASE